MNFNVWIQNLVIIEYKYKAIKDIDLNLDSGCNIFQQFELNLLYTTAVLEDYFLLLKFSFNEYQKPKNIVHQHIYPKKNGSTQEKS